MPITIAYPAEGAPFGPGFRINLSSTLVGPPAVGFKWEIDFLAAPPAEAINCRWTLPAPDQSAREYITGVNDQHGVQFGPVDPRMPHGQPAQIHVKLLDGSTVLESETRAVQADYTSGAPYLLELMQTTATGGLTVQQAAQLESTTAAMAFSLGAGWTNILGDLLNTVGRRLINDVAIAPDREGEGTLPAPVEGLFGVAFGVQWQLVSYPAGFGIDEGVPDRVEIDFMQLSLLQDSDIGLTLSDTRYCNELQGRWYFGATFPDAVEYFIMPGATVRFWWLTMNAGAPRDVAAESPISQQLRGVPSSE